jgi:hypothetical protein
MGFLRFGGQSCTSTLFVLVNCLCKKLIFIAYNTGYVHLKQCDSSLEGRVDFCSTAYKTDYSCIVEVGKLVASDRGEWTMSLKDYSSKNVDKHVFYVDFLLDGEKSLNGSDQLPDIPVNRGVSYSFLLLLFIGL